MKRSSRRRLLRPVVEWFLLIGSIVAGLSVLGACAMTGGTGAGTRAVNTAAGFGFAVLLVGAVFLLTTMSRDLRRMRERYVDDAALNATQPDISTTVESPRADI